jgi:hypothetical protein
MVVRKTTKITEYLIHVLETLIYRKNQNQMND